MMNFNNCTILHNYILVDEATINHNGDLITCVALSEGKEVKIGDEIVVKKHHLQKQVFPVKNKIKIREDFVLGLVLNS